MPHRVNTKAQQTAQHNCLFDERFVEGEVRTRNSARPHARDCFTRSLCHLQFPHSKPSRR
jgi:hypothetical protein